MAETFDKTRDDIALDKGDVLIKPEEYEAKIPASNIAYPCLEMLSGLEEGMVVPLKTGESLIGRAKGNPVRLDDTSVSRAHARLTIEGDRIAIADLGSRNGTTVNGKKIGEGEEHPLSNLDQIKIGIYLFRLLTRAPTKEEEEMEARREEAKNSKAATFVAGSVSDTGSAPGTGGNEAPETPSTTDTPPKTTPPAYVGEESMKTEPAEKALIVHPALGFQDEVLGARSNILKNVFIVISVVTALAGLSYFLFFGPNGKDVQTAPSATVAAKTEEPPAVPPTPETPPAPEVSLTSQESGPPEKLIPEFNVFLDLASQPTTARIFFEGKEIGQTPSKISIPVETGKEYEVVAEFDLKDIRDKYQQKLSFKADPRQEVVPLAFNADIGVIKIQKLPRDVSFYLEGYYAYDKYKANPVKLTEIIYGKPIYVPYGNYTIELREKTRVGDSSTFVDEIRYHRQVEVNADRKVIELAVTERDLQFFPANIRSVPSGADVYFDGEKIGATPYTGELPLGKHELKLVREGFFDNVMPLDMRTNTQFETKIELKTSKVGEFINRAREYRHTGQYQPAIDELVEALKLDAADREKAEIHLLLGDNYFMMGNNQNALTYFEQAKSHADFYYRALVGLARANLATGNRTASLTGLVEVFLNITDADPLKKEALSVFKQLSPLKSVIYVSTEPSGATVYVNNQEAQQKTPVIISDLALGNYRIEIQKTGFEPQQIKKNLKLTEFVPIIVKLKPQGL